MLKLTKRAIRFVQTDGPTLITEKLCFKNDKGLKKIHTKIPQTDWLLSHLENIKYQSHLKTILK